MMSGSLTPSRYSSDELAEEIPDGASIAFSGFGLSGLAQSLCEALVRRHARRGSPGNLTAIHAAGHVEEQGVDLLAQHGLLDRVIGGHWGLMPNVRRRGADEQVELHNWPQGIVIAGFRAAAMGANGLRSRVGLGTFVDPRQLGGCVNARSRRAGSLVTRPEDGEDVLHYAKLKPDYAFIRAWSADRLGNLSFREEALHLCCDHIALATRSNGGRVFCQVRQIEDRIFDANEVDLPGFLVDGLVVAEEPGRQHRHSPTMAYEPALYSKAPARAVEQAGRDPVRNWIGLRAARSICSGDLVNLGIGIPGDTVPAALESSGLLTKIISTLESGVIGGVAAGAADFGVAISPSARISETRMFDLYHGGALDVGIMGMAETDQAGNVNVSQFGGRTVGCGGFIDITQSARRVVFCSGFNGKGFRGSFAGGGLRIHSEGTQHKFVKAVEQITFSSEQARIRGQEVALVTERCVFSLGKKGWVLTEIAPGVDVEKDICAQMGFLPEIAADLQEMDPSIFAT